MRTLRVGLCHNLRLIRHLARSSKKCTFAQLCIPPQVNINKSQPTAARKVPPASPSSTQTSWPTSPLTSNNIATAAISTTMRAPRHLVGANSSIMLSAKVSVPQVVAIKAIFSCKENYSQGRVSCSRGTTLVGLTRRHRRP